MSHVEKTLGDIKAIPRQRLKIKVAKSAAAVVLAGIAALIAWKLPAWPIWVPLVLFGAACHVFSEEWTRGFVRLAVATLRDVVKALSGKNGDAAS